MAEKISVQIALEGGKEVQRQLEGIGEAGQKAFEDIAKSAEQVGGFKNLNPQEVTAKLKELGVEGTAAFDKIQQAVASASRFETLVQGVQSVEAAFAALGQAAGPVGAAIAAAMVAAAKATIGFSETIGKISDQAVKLGQSFEQFKNLRKELEKVGLSADDAAKGLEHFQKQLGEPNQQFFSVLTQTGEAFRFVADTSNLAADKIGAFIERLRQMPDGVERTRLALQQLGEVAGTEVIQGLRRAEGSMSETEAKAYDLQQAIKRLSSAWQEFGSVQLAPTLTTGINEVTAAIETLGAALERNAWGVFLQAASLALNPIAGMVQQATKAILELASSVTGVTWDAIKSGAQAAWQAVVSAVQSAGQAISTFVSSLTGITWDTISNLGVAAWNALTTAVQSTSKAAADFVSSIASAPWDVISNIGVAAWNAVTAAIQFAIDKLKEFLGMQGPSRREGLLGGGGMAGGGVVGGRGTGTSDSNLAWVSRGEHIMPARAVQQPGVLAFLEALRRSGGNLRGVLDGLGRFALGGLVPRPAFAGGGPVGGMSNVTIQFPGLPPIAGLRASAGVVGELQKAAAMAQVRSGGRKPSRYS